MVSKLLLQVSVIELHNSLVSDTNDGGIKDTRYEGNNTIIINYTLQMLFPSQLKQMPALYKVMRGCECCIYAKIIHA